MCVCVFEEEAGEGAHVVTLLPSERLTHDMESETRISYSSSSLAALAARHQRRRRQSFRRQNVKFFLRRSRSNGRE